MHSDNPRPVGIHIILSFEDQHAVQMISLSFSPDFFPFSSFVHSSQARLKGFTVEIICYQVLRQKTK